MLIKREGEIDTHKNSLVYCYLFANCVNKVIEVRLEMKEKKTEVSNMLLNLLRI